MASIEPRKNKDGKITSYRIRVSLGYDEAGNNIRKTTSYKPKATTPAKARKEVEQFAVEFEKAVKDGSAYTDGDRITFAEFVKFWDENSLSQKVLSDTMTKHTREDYNRTMNHHVIPKIGHMKLNQIKATHIDRIVVDLLDAGKKPKTIRNIFNVIRSCFDYAFRKNIIKENPCLRCEPLPVVRRDGDLHTFNEEQVRRFLDEALTMDYEVRIKGHVRKYSVYNGSGQEFEVRDYTEHRSVPLQFRVYFTLAVYGGFRRGEMIGLNWEDVDPENRTITIRKAVSLSDDGQYIKAPKTEAGKRTIKLPEVCFDLLDLLYKAEKSLCLKLGTAWEGYRGRDFVRNPVFITATGARMNVQTPTAKFRKILIAYNETVDEADRLPLIRLHDLRHTSASHLVASGVDIETVAKRLGHSKPSFTLDVYGHALEENDEKASDKLEEIFTKAQ